MQAIGCIGKCTSGLTIEELDLITDNVNKTLSHPQGRKIFRRFLERHNLSTHLECLELYQLCSEFLVNEQDQLQSRNYNLKSLNARVMTVKNIAEELDDVPSLDFVYMEQINQALMNNKKEELLIMLENTRKRLEDYLKNIHGSFKNYISKPCPNTK